MDSGVSHTDKTVAKVYVKCLMSTLPASSTCSPATPSLMIIRFSTSVRIDYISDLRRNIEWAVSVWQPMLHTCAIRGVA